MSPLTKYLSLKNLKFYSAEKTIPGASVFVRHLELTKYVEAQFHSECLNLNPPTRAHVLYIQGIAWGLSLVTNKGFDEMKGHFIAAFHAFDGVLCGLRVGGAGCECEKQKGHHF